MGGGTPCPPQVMPPSIPNCAGVSVGGGAPCQILPIDTGCVSIGSQPMGGVPCAPPDQGMAVGGCPDMAMPGTSCVIQGKLVEGSPNVTIGGVPYPLPGKGPNGTTPGPGPQPGVNATTIAPIPTPPPGKKI